MAIRTCLLLAYHAPASDAELMESTGLSQGGKHIAAVTPGVRPNENLTAR